MKKFKLQPILPDHRYNDATVAKFINQVMRRGKKTIAAKIVYEAFDKIKEQTKQDPLEIFNTALEKAAPLVEVKPQRVGGATYQVPREVKGKRRESLGMRWLIGAARSKKGKPMAEKLAQEIMLASRDEGDAIKKKINVHRMAEANRAFAHLAR